MSEKRDHERRIFERFLAISPTFAGELLAEWHQPADEKDFPDITGVSASGRRIGVELGEWLNEEEIQFAKRKERLEDSMLQAIGDQGLNETCHVDHVWLHPKPKARIRPADADAFRHQLFACIHECDRRWPTEHFWHSPQGAQLVNDELAPYPVVAKHLHALKLWSRENGGQWPAAVDWITFPFRGGAF